MLKTSFRLLSLLYILSLGQCCFGQEFSFNPIEPETVVSFRGLSVVDDNVAWLSGTNGTFGSTNDGGRSWSYNQVNYYETADFRNIYAFDAQRAIIANAGYPATILYTENGGRHWKKVYENKDSSAFFDGIDFWNEKEGIIYGDPIEGKLHIMITEDGGKSWKQLDGPELVAGEASFAASGTGVRCLANGKVSILTGGKQSRLLLSDNKGQTWKATKLSMLQGQASQGAFSHSYGSNGTLIVVGGDYLKDTLRKNHILLGISDQTTKWRMPTQSTRGYRESVENIRLKTRTNI